MSILRIKPHIKKDSGYVGATEKRMMIHQIAFVTGLSKESASFAPDLKTCQDS